MYKRQVLILSYVIGSLSSGRIIAKSRGVQIDSVGSGNVGATNVARSIGKSAGILTLLLDILKGFIATKIGLIFADATNQPTLVAISMIAVICGHCFSLPKLKGGKGVATTAGVLLGINSGIFAVTIAVFLLTFALSRIVSLASIIAALSLPISTAIFRMEQFPIWAALAISVLVVFRHKDNIKRLRVGKEKKFT